MNNMSKISKQTHSQEEADIRAFAIGRLRELIPSARIMEEVRIFDKIVDILAVTEEKIVTVELKSAKDKLDRLEAQASRFSGFSHVFVACTHLKFWTEDPYKDGRPRCVPGEKLSQSLEGIFCEQWCYPHKEVEPNSYDVLQARFKNLLRMSYLSPDAYLNWLHAPELKAIAKKYGANVSKFKGSRDIYKWLSWNLTGKIIAQEACRQLRARDYSFGDAPILCEEGVSNVK